MEKQEEKNINLLLLTPVQRVHRKKANKLQTIKQGRYTRSTLPHANLQGPRGFHRSFSSIANKAEGKNTQYTGKKLMNLGFLLHL